MHIFRLATSFAQTLKLPQDKPLLGLMEESIMRYTRMKGFISHFYDYFLSYDPQSIDTAVERWEKDLQTEYEKDM